MQTKIDCSIAENYIKEIGRMCNTRNSCRNCTLQPLKNANSCILGQMMNPQKAIKLIQAWSDEHPVEPAVTYLDKLLEVFPNTKIIKNGTPFGICPHHLGLQDIPCGETDEKCFECWSQPYKENDK